MKLNLAVENFLMDIRFASIIVLVNVGKEILAVLSTSR
jgi:hypothetical protein